jgi:hypothetical protein
MSDTTNRFGTHLTPLFTDYTVQYRHIVRDALDHKKKTIGCNVAYINDSLDHKLYNADWYIHPDFPELLLVIATKDIKSDEQIYLPYGPDYWCQDKFSLTTLRAAIACYNIDIHSSQQWKALHRYSQLCSTTTTSATRTNTQTPTSEDGTLQDTAKKKRKTKESIHTAAKGGKRRLATDGTSRIDSHFPHTHAMIDTVNTVSSVMNRTSESGNFFTSPIATPHTHTSMVEYDKHISNS